jgi:hypothetical protein
MANQTYFKTYGDYLIAKAYQNGSPIYSVHKKEGRGQHTDVGVYGSFERCLQWIKQRGGCDNPARS